MQSFSFKAKSELCRTAVQRLCCARAECYGVLLYCNTFTMREVRIITENPEFAARLPRLFHRAFGVKFDRQPADELPGSKLVFQITEAEKLYHLELSTSHVQASREVSALLQEIGFMPRSVMRSGSAVIYFKQSEHIEDLLTMLGAPVAATEIMTAKVDKEIRNGANRAMNCDMANVNKTLDAVAAQQEAIETLKQHGQLEKLPEKIQETARLRMQNPELPLAQLAALFDPPISKSCLNHRIRKIMEEARKLS